jgi:HSP20 family protein
MAKSTRGDSSRDTASRQTSRRPSTDSVNTRGATASGTQSASRGTQTRSTSGTTETTPRAAQTPQSNTAGQTNQARQPGAPDRERSIETRNETDEGRSPDQTTASGLSRRQGTSPVVGSVISMNPFAAMRRWSEDMDRLFQDFGLGQFGLGGSPLRELGTLGGRFGSGQNDSSEWSPQVEAFQRGDKFVVRADLPGMKKDDVTVEVENNMLTISGERTDEREDNRDGYYRSERSYGQFYRAIPLPEGVNAEQCDATFKDGVLEVSLKVPQQRERSKQIPIR